MLLCYFSGTTSSNRYNVLKFIFLGLIAHFAGVIQPNLPLAWSELSLIKTLKICSIIFIEADSVKSLFPSHFLVSVLSKTKKKVIQKYKWKAYFYAFHIYVNVENFSAIMMLKD